MWVVKWNMTSNGRKDYLREMFYEGKILQFEWEEDALRFLESLRSLNSNNLRPISYNIQRFSGDRREKFKLVKATVWQRTVDDVACGIDIEQNK